MNRTGLDNFIDNPQETTSRAYYPGVVGGGHWPHLPLPAPPRASGWLKHLPQVVALVSALVVQLARQAGHRGSELHRLQDLPRWLHPGAHVACRGSFAESQGTRWGPGQEGQRVRAGPSHPSHLCPPLPLLCPPLPSVPTLPPLPAPPASAHPSLPRPHLGDDGDPGPQRVQPHLPWGPRSIQIPPSAASTSRSRPPAREDFPAPVLPTMPTARGWDGMVCSKQAWPEGGHRGFLTCL